NRPLNVDHEGHVMGFKERSRERRRRIVTHIAHSHEEAEQWDLAYWQNLSPHQRMAALESLKRDVEKIKRRRQPETHANTTRTNQR
ncbi:MAG: hypothetical protein U9R68_05525, partial [Planctomycetota bacterium]|nr:hypothetical protein [Planctomycetota bacterium]